MNEEVKQCKYSGECEICGCDPEKYCYTKQVLDERNKAEDTVKELLEENKYFIQFHDKVIDIFSLPCDYDCSNDEYIENYGKFLQSINKGYDKLLTDMFRLQSIAGVHWSMGLYPLGVAHKLNLYRHTLDKITQYCESNICLTGDLPFRTTDSDILEIIYKMEDKNHGRY